jgi:ribonuclease HI
MGALLPILSYGAPIWIECLKRKHNVTKLKRVQRLINIKIVRVYHTISHEALCILTGITPIQIELRSQAKCYYITRGNAQVRLHDVPKHYRKWSHPAEAIEIKEKCERGEYTIEVYTDGSKSISGVGSGIAIFINKHLAFQLMYKLVERCSNNQAEQLAIAKALEKIQDLNHLQGNQRSVAIHTDSRITLNALVNPRNHQNLVEQMRDEIRRFEHDNWTIHFTWVKAHDDNYGNKLADQLAKEAASSSKAETAYNKIPESAVVRELKEEGELVWQREWDASTKGEIKSFFPIIRHQISKRLQMGINLSIVTGQGTLRSYYHRFKITDDPKCVCKMGPQITYYGNVNC